MDKIIRITTVPNSMFLMLRNQLRYMSQYYEVIGVCSPGDLFSRIEEQEGVRMVPLDMTRKITPIKDLVALIRLYRLFKKEKPQIVHTHSPKAGLLGMMAARISGVPVRLHTVAGLPLLEVHGFKRRILDLIEKITYSCATMVYPNSSRMREIILDNGYCDPGKVRVLGAGSSNGIDLNYFNPALFSEARKTGIRGSLGFSDDHIVFCYVGRLVKPKGIRELLSAFTKMCETDSRLRLIFVGGFDNDKDQLDPSTVKQIKSHPCIHSTGFQDDVRPYLAASDVFVFPSYREGFPNVVMQACAMNLPCIVTDINGSNELIQNGGNGIIVPVKDREALMRAMRRLTADEALRAQMAAQSRASLLNNYDQQFIFKTLLEEYRMHQSQVAV